MSQSAFSSLPLNPALLANLESLGYASMTPIQAQSLPAVIAGKDVIAQGKTGSGKTAAFSLGLLHKLNVKRFAIQSVVLCPTRELADQVAKEIRRLARAIHNIKVLTLCGGMPFGPQIGSLEHGAHIVVGTPGRVEEHIRKGTLVLNQLTTLVLDEADRMLEMGFQESLDNIVAAMPDKRQTLLFSATFPEQIEAVAKRVLRQPVRIEVESTHDNITIQQSFFKVDSNNDRLTALRLLLLKHRPQSAVVFCTTKRECQEVSDELCKEGFSSVALHGDMEQRDRDQTLVRFSNKSASILVATDVASRGLDIDNLDAVINFHLARDPEVHVHRIGRTGRAGSKGLAFSLYVGKENHIISMIEDYLNIQIAPEQLPDIDCLDKPVFYADMVTLQLDSGKKQKIRPGDILGALTGNNGVAGSDVGKINMYDNWAYVAVHRDVAKVALAKLSEGKLKGRSVRVRRIRG